MKRDRTVWMGIGMLLLLLAAAAASSAESRNGEAEPASGFRMPDDYRDWKLITVAREGGTLDDIRAVLGNDLAIDAYRSGKRPFPDGTVIARLAWEPTPLADSERAFGQAQSHVAGAPKNGVQFMVKDSVRFATTDGWGFAHFDDGKPASAGVHDSCLPCHQIAADRDLVFSSYAP